MNLQPAYGRDYPSRKAVLDDFVSGKDFIDSPSGSYLNLSDIETLPDGTFLQFRYGKLRKTFGIKLAEIRKAVLKRSAAPPPRLSFDSWLQQVDKICIDLTGLGYMNFRDVDFAGNWEAGTAPGDMAMEVIKDL